MNDILNSLRADLMDEGLPEAVAAIDELIAENASLSKGYCSAVERANNAIAERDELGSLCVSYINRAEPAERELTKLKAEHQQYVEWAEPQITLPINEHMLNRFNEVTAERNQLKTALELLHGRPFSLRDYTAMAARITQLDKWKENAISVLQTVAVDLYVLGLDTSDIRDAIAKCGTNDPEFQPLDTNGRPPPAGHFLRSDNDPFICKRCGQPHSAHTHTDEASRCPETKPPEGDQS